MLHTRLPGTECEPKQRRQYTLVGRHSQCGVPFLQEARNDSDRHYDNEYRCTDSNHVHQLRHLLRGCRCGTLGARILDRVVLELSVVATIRGRGGRGLYESLA